MDAKTLATKTASLVTLPEVYLRARAVLNDPHSPLTRVGDVISNDPAMTARLLRIANSAFFGYTARIDTVSRAVSILGAARLHDLLLATSVTGALSTFDVDGLDMHDYWCASVRRGAWAKVLAAACNVLDSERLFVQGLLADVGRLVLSCHCREAVAEALARVERDGVPLHVAERDLLGFDCAECGAALLEVWGLPESICEAVRFQLDLPRAVRFPLETSLVHIARHAADHCGDDWPARVDATAWAATGLEATRALELEEEVEGYVHEAIGLIFAAAVPARA